MCEGVKVVFVCVVDVFVLVKSCDLLFGEVFDK